MKVFALNSSRYFGEVVAVQLSIPLSMHEEQDFDDGEHQCYPLDSVLGQDVFVIQSLFEDPSQTIHDKLCRLLFFIGALRDASARHITAILPYLCYARQDQKSKPQGPVTTRYVATLLEAVQADEVVTMDVHDIAAYQNAFRIPSQNLEARDVFIEHLLPLITGKELAILSPDIGGVKRAELFQKALQNRSHKEITMSFVEKYRKEGKLSGGTLVGDVSGRTVLIVDDMISTGGTIARAVAACKTAGVQEVWAIATHGIFCGMPEETLGDEMLKKIFVTNTIPPYRLEPAGLMQKLQIVDVSSLFAAVIKSI